MAATSDKRRAQLEALRRSLARENSVREAAPVAKPAASTPSPDVEEVREAVRRAALARLKAAPAASSSAASPAPAVPAASAASASASPAPAADPASASPAAPASPVPAAAPARAATPVAPAVPFTTAFPPASPGAPRPGTPAPGSDPEAARTMREYVSELLNPTKDRGANILVEPDHEAISKGKGRHYAKTGGHARSAIAFVLEFLLIFVIALVLIFPIRAFVAEYYYIPSGSMEETLQIDDRILSEKLSYYFDTPKQGQIVTFEGIKEEAGQTLIKRVIAVGGQTVDLRNDSVYVDGEKLDEPYTDGKESVPLSNSNGITYPYKVPQGEIWVMGDNRTNSLDSRVFGSVPVENVTGHAFWRYWPLNSFGALG